MIKKFSEHINEDYFSKLASRKDNSNVRMENKIKESDVFEYFDDMFSRPNISIRYNGLKPIVDVDGNFYFRCGRGTEDMQFKFGIISGDFDCSYSSQINNLEWCPEEVCGYFNCDNCRYITSLEGCPKKVGGKFCCRFCGARFTKEEVKSLCDVKGDILV